MKAVVFVVLTLTLPVWAQVAQEQSKGVTLAPTPPAYTTVVTEANQPVTHSDLYCSGYVSPQAPPRDHFVAGGLNTPLQGRFTAQEFIYVQGTGLTPGARVSLVRPMQDANRMQPFPGEHGKLRGAGQVYGDLGYAVVIGQRGETTIAKLEFTCEDIVPGDLVLPFEIRMPVNYRVHSTVDLFPAEAATVSGNIVAARDFDQYLGSNRKVYLNIGSNQGVQPGTYFRIVRGYDRDSLDVTDVATYGQTMQEDTQKNAPKLSQSQHNQLPRHMVGELLVLRSLPTTSTAMITFAMEDVHIGDRVELEPQH